MLEDGVDAALVGRKRVEARAAHPDFAGGGLFEASDEAEKRGFAGAAFAEQGEKFAGCDLQADVFQDRAGTEIFGDVADFQQGCAGSGSRRGAG